MDRINASNSRNLQGNPTVSRQPHPDILDTGALANHDFVNPQPNETTNVRNLHVNSYQPPSSSSKRSADLTSSQPDVKRCPLSALQRHQVGQRAEYAAMGPPYFDQTVFSDSNPFAMAQPMAGLPIHRQLQPASIQNPNYFNFTFASPLGSTQAPTLQQGPQGFQPSHTLRFNPFAQQTSAFDPLFNFATSTPRFPLYLPGSQATMREQDGIVGFRSPFQQQNTFPYPGVEGMHAHFATSTPPTVASTGSSVEAASAARVTESGTTEMAAPLALLSKSPPTFTSSPASANTNLSSASSQGSAQTSALAPLQPQASTQPAAQATWLSKRSHIPDPNRFAPQAQPPFDRTQPPPAAPTLRPGNQAMRQRAANNRNGKNYGQNLIGCPPVNVQPPLNVTISIREILTFCPEWLHIPDVAMRTECNEFKRGDLAKMQLHPLNQLTKEEMKACGDRIQKQRSSGCRIYNGKSPTGGRKELTWKSKTVRGHHHNDLTANDWELKSQYGPDSRPMDFGHIKLRDIYGRVPIANWPQGPDRLIFTECLEYAAQNPQFDLDTSHFDWIIQTQGLQDSATGAGGDFDVAALNRFSQAVPTPRV